MVNLNHLLVCLGSLQTYQDRVTEKKAQRKLGLELGPPAQGWISRLCLGLSSSLGWVRIDMRTVGGHTVGHT